MIKLLLFFSLLSCATAPEKSAPENAGPFKVHKFSTAKEARNFITNRSRYLKLLFEQAYDPYYNTPKWSEDCLRKNVIGNVVNQSGHVLFSSRLVLNSQGEPGHCTGREAEVVYVQCGDEPLVSEFHARVNNPCSR